jgi:hypothetical protein
MSESVVPRHPVSAAVWTLARLQTFPAAFLGTLCDRHYTRYQRLVIVAYTMLGMAFEVTQSSLTPVAIHPVCKLLGFGVGAIIAIAGLRWAFALQNAGPSVGHIRGMQMILSALTAFTVTAVMHRFIAPDQAARRVSDGIELALVSSLLMVLLRVQVRRSPAGHNCAGADWIQPPCPWWAPRPTVTAPTAAVSSAPARAT